MMRNLSSVVWLSSLFILGPSFAASAEEKPDPAIILKELQQKYLDLRTYHFEHTVVVEDTPAGAKPTKLAEVTLITATEDAKQVPSDSSPARPGLNLDRCRLEIKHARSSFVVACNGETSWLYLPNEKAYRKGGRGGSVTGPTAGAMLLGLHLSSLCKILEANPATARLARSETLRLDQQTKECFVVEASLRPPPQAPLPEGVKLPETLRDFNPLAGAAGVLSLLEIHSLTDSTEAAMYLPRRPRRESKITLWIDQKVPIVWRTAVVDQSLKVTHQEENRVERPTELRLTDTFALCQIAGPLPERLFTIDLPSDAKEVKEVDEHSQPSQQGK